MDGDTDYTMVFTTFPDEAGASALAHQIVSAGLAACVNILPAMQSVYRWKGVMETGREHLLMIKTRRDRYPALELAIKAGHPYELPEIIAVPVSAGLPAYLAWIDETVRIP